MTSTSKSVEGLLFDLGGVIVEIDFDRALRSWSLCSRLTLGELRERFAMDEAYRRHERGEIDALSYFAHLRSRLELDADDAAIVRGWNAIFTGQIDATLSLLRSLDARMPRFLFSNTNATHQQAWTTAYPEVPKIFDRVFTSFEIGLRKPEREAFDAVSRTCGVALDALLFFDDTPENVDAARAAGMRAVLVDSAADVERGLADAGLLNGMESRLQSASPLATGQP